MKLEDQVVSLEIAKKLKELGVKQESLFYWCEFEDNSEPKTLIGKFNINEFPETLQIGRVFKNDDLSVQAALFDGGYEYDILTKDVKYYWSAYTATELMVIYPGYFELIKDKEGRYLTVIPPFEEIGGTSAEACGKMLIWVLENEYIKVEELNDGR